VPEGIWVELPSDNFGGVQQYTCNLGPGDPGYISLDQLQSTHNGLAEFRRFVAAKGGVLRVPAVKVGHEGIMAVALSTGLGQSGCSPLPPVLLDSRLVAPEAHTVGNSAGSPSTRSQASIEKLVGQTKGWLDAAEGSSAEAHMWDVGADSGTPGDGQF